MARLARHAKAAPGRGGGGAEQRRARAVLRGRRARARVAQRRRDHAHHLHVPPALSRAAAPFRAATLRALGRSRRRASVVHCGWSARARARPRCSLQCDVSVFCPVQPQLPRRMPCRAEPALARSPPPSRCATRRPLTTRLAQQMVRIGGLSHTCRQPEGQTTSWCKVSVWPQRRSAGFDHEDCHETALQRSHSTQASEQEIKYCAGRLQGMLPDTLQGMQPGRCVRHLRAVENELGGQRRGQHVHARQAAPQVRPRRLPGSPGTPSVRLRPGLCAMPCMPPASSLHFFQAIEV